MGIVGCEEIEGGAPSTLPVFLRLCFAFQRRDFEGAKLVEIRWRSSFSFFFFYNSDLN